MFNFLKQQFYKLAIYVSELPFADDDERLTSGVRSTNAYDINTDGSPLAGRAYGTVSEF